MSDTTTRYFVITAQSCSGLSMGKTLFLGFGKSEKDAWEDATGQTFRKKPDWDCRECDADFYGSKGTAGEMLSFCPLYTSDVADDLPCLDLGG